MKNTKALIGLVALVTCLWAAAVTTYATQMKNDHLDGKAVKPLPLTNASCSSSSSSSGNE
jgi:hypothetical protein